MITTDNTIRNPYIGHPSQLVRINDYRMTGGFADGMRAADINNGTVQLTVLPDRGMDIPYFSYKGVNTGYIAPAGMVAPAYYDDKGAGFLRGFNAGFLTTCGITYMGAASDADGVHYGLHGRISYTPAEQYSSALTGQEGVPAAVLSGTMRQAVLFGENVTMTRRLSCGLEQNGFCFSDTVVNQGYRRQQHMLLYHFNLGYPLLDENAELFIPSTASRPRDPHAETGYDERMHIPAPVTGYAEMCYFYDVKTDSAGRCRVGAYNHKLGFGVSIQYDAVLLDHFTQWKMVAPGEYTIGLEPGNATPLGVKAERELGHVKYLEPGESRRYDFRVDVIEGGEQFAALKKELEV